MGSIRVSKGRDLYCRKQKQLHTPKLWLWRTNQRGKHDDDDDDASIIECVCVMCVCVLQSVCEV